MRTPLSISLTVALIACAETTTKTELGPQFGSETLVCDEAARTAVALDEEVVVGSRDAVVTTTAQQTIAYAEGARDDTLTWMDSGDTTDLAATITYDGGAIELVEYVQEPCDTLLSIPVAVTLSTTDGALDEAWTSALVARSGHDAGVYGEVDLRGALEPADHLAHYPQEDPAEFASGRISVGIHVAADSFTGQIRAIYQGSDDQHEPDLAIGSWGAAEDE